MPDRPKVLILGPNRGPNMPLTLSRYLARAADRLEVPYGEHNTLLAYPRSPELQTIYQRVWRPEPMLLRVFSSGVVKRVQREGFRYVLASGDAPLTMEALQRLRDLGVCVFNYSTDDPWGSRWRRWRIPTLAGYAAIFTPRHANFEQLRQTGCPQVEWLPFGYDDAMHRPATAEELRTETRSADVVFIGGGDQDRVPYMRALVAGGLRVALYGAGWSAYRDLRHLHGGRLRGREMATVLARATLSVCLVRRANRDEHVMRTYEEPAMGAAVMMEDTADHRALFVEEAARAGFFQTPQELAARARELHADRDRREAMRASVTSAVVGGHNTYTDRLRTMLAAVGYPL